MAEMERNMIIERTQAGKEVAKTNQDIHKVDQRHILKSS